QVLWQWELLRGRPALVLPGCECFAVTSVVLPVAAEREQDERSRTEVDQLPAQSRRDANELALPERHLLALHQQRELALEHQIRLLLALVAVDSSTLARLQDDLVHPERAHAELTAQGNEPLACVAIQLRACRATLHRGHVRTPTVRARRAINLNEVGHIAP